MTDEDARHYAKELTPTERQIIMLCSKTLSWKYDGLAEKEAISYFDAKNAGNRLQSMNLASIMPTRRGNEYSGSAIFLNDRGEQVKLACTNMKLRRHRATNN